MDRACFSYNVEHIGMHDPFPCAAGSVPQGKSVVKVSVVFQRKNPQVLIVCMCNME